ncbi:MAG TPA: Rieske 2Fe-2S domain-containing protein [Thermoanaerobaculia bacterium]|nr:Rieske 2Fe-2S domain-containing protein [Thermoanaerobaculia bacterium]
MKFADASRVKQGWYLLARSRRLRRHQVRAAEVGPRRLVLYRDGAGRAHVAADRCPHLGSDLALGKVTAEGLCCPFHGWCWDAEGACAVAPGQASPPQRRLRQYATEERWGFLWAWLGTEPAFPLPDIAAETTATPRRFALPPQRVKAHADVVFANLFDVAHFAPSHGIELSSTALDEDAPWRLTHRFTGRLPRRQPLSAVGLAGQDLDATATQYGGGIVHVRVRRPLPYTILFTLRPDGTGSRAQTTLFLERRRDAPRAAALLWSIAADDLEIMETIDWTGAYAAGDEVLARYARFVEALPAW